MGSRNRSLFYSFFITALIAGTIIYLYGVKPPPSSNEDGESFSKEDVIQLSWSFKETSFIHSKDQTSGLWTPNIEPERIISKLSLLSKLKLQSISLADFDIENGLEVKIKFKNGTEWSGVYFKEHFIWQNGELTGQGAILSQDETEHFHEGRFAFEPLSWSWCSDQIRKITLDINEEAIELSQVGDSWEITSLSGDEKMVESAWVESWIEKSCQVQIKAWVDLELEPFGLDEGRLEIERADGIPNQYPIRDSAIQISESKALLAPELLQNFEELFTAP